MKISSYSITYPKYYKSSSPNFGAKTPASLVSKFVHIEKSGYHPNIQAAMKRFAEYDIEHGNIFTRDGILILETVGDKHHPYSDEGYKKIVIPTLEAYPGHIFMHNHPDFDKFGHPKPITIIDAYVSSMNDASESIVVHPDYTYSSVKCLPSKSIIDYEATDKLKIALYLLDVNDREALNSSGMVSDKWWRNNAERLGVIYTNTHDYTKMTV